MGKAHPFAMRASGDVRGRDDKSGAEPLIDDQDEYWHGMISVGTPPVNFTGKRPRFFETLSICRSKNVVGFNTDM
jgi:hypothetical protein